MDRIDLTNTVRLIQSNLLMSGTEQSATPNPNVHQIRCMHGSACYKTSDPAHTAKFSHEKSSAICKNAYMGCTNAYCLYTHPVGTTAPPPIPITSEPRREYKPYVSQPNRPPSQSTQSDRPNYPNRSAGGPTFMQRQNPSNLIANPYDLNKAYGVPKPPKYDIRKEIFDSDSSDSDSEPRYSESFKKPKDTSTEQYQNKISELKYINKELETELAKTKAELAKTKKKLAAIRTTCETVSAKSSSRSHHR